MLLILNSTPNHTIICKNCLLYSPQRQILSNEIWVQETWFERNLTWWLPILWTFPFGYDHRIIRINIKKDLWKVSTDFYVQLKNCEIKIFWKIKSKFLIKKNLVQRRDLFGDKKYQVCRNIYHTQKHKSMQLKQGVFSRYTPQLITRWFWRLPQGASGKQDTQNDFYQSVYLFS